VKLKILSVGAKSPEWIQRGFDEYQKRLSREMPLELVEISPGKHHKDPAKFKAEEGTKMLAALTTQDWVVSLDERGKSVTSRALAGRLEQWREFGKDVVIVIGGSDGLDKTVLSRAQESLSLSALTFPHYLVRVIVAEALYRAWTITRNHPYHRA
jgi:23S rRNA (pseudouridine1915-N3)-methyltransferase